MLISTVFSDVWSGPGRISRPSAQLGGVGRLFLVSLFLVSFVFAQDPEFTNYRSGIDVTYSGTKGVDYMEEYLYHDKLITDRKVVYIKSTTEISMAHNDRNIARVYYACQVIGKNGLDGQPNTGDEGVIRYKIDGDMGNDLRWTSGQGGTPNPVYTAPLSFESLRYPAGVARGVKVLGQIGSNGAPISPKSGYFHYGILDSVGDEWHTIQVADDDWSVTGADTEWRASDGRVHIFVVNPKTAAITVRSTGGGEFYTTPAKNYHVPKIFDQITYIAPNSGSVSFELRDLFGADVVYRINGGSWTTVRVANIADSAFPNGASTLEFYVVGKEQYKKVRRVVKNPPHPSLKESHGKLLFGSDSNIEAAKARRSIDPYKYYWDRLVRGSSDSGNRAAWDRMRRTGRRFPYAQGSLYGAEPSPTALPNAVVALLNGPASVPQGSSKRFAEYAKEMILENSRVLDNVGFELHHAGYTLPTRELTYRGYYDVDTTFDMAYSYDILVSIYRSDQISGGITPIEDVYLRDSIANNIVECMQYFAGMPGPGGVYTDEGGMWDVARKCGALVGMFAMPTYSTHYYGTSGLDGNTTVYPYTPFPNSPLTWKKVMLDEDAPMLGYPNLATRLGLENYNCLPDGRFADKTDYWMHVGASFAHVLNVLSYHYPTKRLPYTEKVFLNAAKGQLYGTKAGTGGLGPAKSLHLALYNQNFPEIATAAFDTIRSVPSNNQYSDNQLINGSFITSLAWYDSKLVVTGLPSAPSGLIVK